MLREGRRLASPVEGPTVLTPPSPWLHADPDKLTMHKEVITRRATLEQESP
jgi:hypothetical protein